MIDELLIEIDKCICCMQASFFCLHFFSIHREILINIDNFQPLAFLACSRVCVIVVQQAQGAIGRPASDLLYVVNKSHGVLGWVVLFSNFLLSFYFLRFFL